MLEGRGLTLLLSQDGGEPVMWHGMRRGQGHYSLTSERDAMQASLHRFADSAIMEGIWIDGPDRGFWRLRMPMDNVAAHVAPVSSPQGDVLMRARRSKPPKVPTVPKVLTVPKVPAFAAKAAAKAAPRRARRAA